MSLRKREKKPKSGLSPLTSARLSAALLLAVAAPQPGWAQSAPAMLGDAIATIPSAYPAASALPGYDIRPRPQAPGRKKPKAQANPLPALAPYPSSAAARLAARQKSGAAPTDPMSLPPPPTVAMPAPIPRHTPPRADADPFAPVGVNLGLLRVKPYAETDFGFSDNPGLDPKGSPQLRGSSFVREELGLTAASDWSNHALTADMKLGYDSFFANHPADAPDGSGKFLLRLDVTRQTKVNVDGNYTIGSQGATSANLNNNGLPISLSNRPITAVYGGGVGATETFNRLELTLRGSVDRTYWANAHFTDGSVQPLSQDSYNALGLTMRGAYELTPGIKPFVEARLDRRTHDSAIDTTGYARNSTGDAIRAGSTFELSRLLTGEVAAGYGQRHYQDARLAELRGPMFDSSLIWTATPLTTVTLRASTTMDETTIPGSAGAITHSESIELAHALLRDLTIKATGGVFNSNYQGSPINQTLISEGLAVDYNLTRSVVLRGGFTHQRMISNTAGLDYTANVIMVGMRLQQ